MKATYIGAALVAGLIVDLGTSYILDNGPLAAAASTVVIIVILALARSRPQKTVVRKEP